MTSTPDQLKSLPDPGPVAGPVPRSLLLAAAARLVGGSGVRQARGARNLIEAAPAHGIDLDLFFACRVGETVGPVCLAVPGPGKTAVLFLSEPAATPETDDDAERRAAAVRAAVVHLTDHRPELRLLQALPGPGEGWAIEALEGGGLTRIAALSYLRRPITREDRSLCVEAWPEGISVTPVGRLGDPDDHAVLAAALLASYEDTLDCPELCGLRDLSDIIESHRAAGQFDPALWRLVRRHGEPVGCCLLNRNPSLDTVELVYLGLSARVRGLGLGGLLLRDSVARAAALSPEPTLTCAVDERNGPALRLYERFGFERFDTKLAYIKGL
ncbi:MAG: GNAT family N-acetyltransferase [Phycisphaerales bacterium JB040]